MFDNGEIILLVPIVALMIPIVKMMTKHQRDMAELHLKAHQTQGLSFQESGSQETAQLRDEVRQLRETVSTLVLKVEDLSSRNDLENRIQIGD